MSFFSHTGDGGRSVQSKRNLRNFFITFVLTEKVCDLRILPFGSYVPVNMTKAISLMVWFDYETFEHFPFKCNNATHIAAKLWMSKNPSTSRFYRANNHQRFIVLQHINLLKSTLYKHWINLSTTFLIKGIIFNLYIIR